MSGRWLSLANPHRPQFLIGGIKMKQQGKKRCQRKAITSEHQALKKLRLDLKLTLVDAGKLVGLSSKGIGAIENGRVLLTKEKIEKIVTSYGLTFLDYSGAKKIIERSGLKTSRRAYVKSVLTSSDRRSYQKRVTKECRVLKCMRKMKNLSQDQASSLCGYSRPTIGHIENGRIELSNSRINHIVSSYHFQMSDFYRFMEEEVLKNELLQSCLDKMNQLPEDKLKLMSSLLLTF